MNLASLTDNNAFGKKWNGMPLQSREHS